MNPAAAEVAAGVAAGVTAGVAAGMADMPGAAAAKVVAEVQGHCQHQARCCCTAMISHPDPNQMALELIHHHQQACRREYFCQRLQPALTQQVIVSP